MLKVLIIDDEKDAVSGLKSLLELSCPQVNVCGTANSAIEGLKKCRQLKPDLVFLDVEMPGGTGFDFLEEATACDFKVIFTTAYKDYAIKALRANASDYLLKPVDADELKLAVEQIEKIFMSDKNVKTDEASFKIQLSDSSGTVFVSPEEIIHIQGEGRYSNVYINNGKKFTVSKNLGEFEKELISRNFFRVHKSHLINCIYVSKITNKDGGFAELSNGKMIEISRRKKSELIEKLRIRGTRHNS